MTCCSPPGSSIVSETDSHSLEDPSDDDDDEDEVMAYHQERLIVKRSSMHVTWWSTCHLSLPPGLVIFLLDGLSSTCFILNWIGDLLASSYDPNTLLGPCMGCRGMLRMLGRDSVAYWKRATWNCTRLYIYIYLQSACIILLLNHKQYIMIPDKHPGAQLHHNHKVCKCGGGPQSPPVNGFIPKNFYSLRPCFPGWPSKGRKKRP